MTQIIDVSLASLLEDEKIDSLYHARISDDYVKDYEDLVDGAFEELKALPDNVLVPFITYSTDCYIETTGEVPSHKALNRLTELVLWKNLEGDTRRNKAKDEFPILSDTQYDKRTKGRSQNAKAHGETNREVYVDMSYLASDGRDYRPPVRRYE